MLKPLIEFDYWGLPIYNIMGAVGLLFALVIILRKQKKIKLDVYKQEKVNVSFILAGFSAIAFANLSNWFLFPVLLKYPIIQRITNGGLSFYYGMLSFFFLSAVFLRLFKTDYKYWVNEAVPAILIFHAFGRIGCSLAGCCYGRELHRSVNIFGLNIELFPAREIEAICLFILFFVFSCFIKKNRLFWYLTYYSILRFFIEFGRGDNRGQLLTDKVSPAQVTSFIIWIVLIGWSIHNPNPPAKSN